MENENEEVEKRGRPRECLFEFAMDCGQCNTGPISLRKSFLVLLFIYSLVIVSTHAC